MHFSSYDLMECSCKMSHAIRIAFGTTPSHPMEKISWGSRGISIDKPGSPYYSVIAVMLRTVYMASLAYQKIAQM